MEEVDEYLWEVYQRTAVKSDSSGDFTWKDLAAAKRAGMSVRDYVIGGMDADFREQLYHAGRAMDSNGINWSMLSAFRDDYRQSLASGFTKGLPAMNSPRISVTTSAVRPSASTATSRIIAAATTCACAGRPRCSAI
jgi:hypothetical protein